MQVNVGGDTRCVSSDITVIICFADPAMNKL